MWAMAGTWTALQASLIIFLKLSYIVRLEVLLLLKPSILAELWEKLNLPFWTSDSEENSTIKLIDEVESFQRFNETANLF